MNPSSTLSQSPSNRSWRTERFSITLCPLVDPVTTPCCKRSFSRSPPSGRTAPQPFMPVVPCRLEELHGLIADPPGPAAALGRSDPPWSAMAARAQLCVFSTRNGTLCVQFQREEGSDFLPSSGTLAEFVSARYPGVPFYARYPFTTREVPGETACSAISENIEVRAARDERPARRRGVRPAQARVPRAGNDGRPDEPGPAGDVPVLVTTRRHDFRQGPGHSTRTTSSLRIPRGMTRDEAAAHMKASRSNPKEIALWNAEWRGKLTWTLGDLWSDADRQHVRGSSILPCKSCDVPRRMMEEAGRSWNAVCGVNFREARAGERAPVFGRLYGGAQPSNRPSDILLPGRRRQDALHTQAILRW